MTGASGAGTPPGPKGGEAAAVRSLAIVSLALTGRCNCRCAMCDIWEGADPAELPVEEVARRIPELRALDVRRVMLTGGEPLLHRRFDEVVGLLGEAGFAISVVTTGLLLERHAAALARHADEVVVSLDGPPAVHDGLRGVRGAFARLETAVPAFRAAAPETRLGARTVVQRRNAEVLRETALAARRLGFDSISFLAADLTSDAFGRREHWSDAKSADVAIPAAELGRLSEEIEALAADGTLRGFVAESPAKLRRIVRHFEAAAGLAEPVAPRCNAPWVSAVVELDGTVRPCFFQPSIGSWSGRALADVVDGEPARAFRERLDVPTDETCRRCTCSVHVEDADAAGARRTAG